MISMLKRILLVTLLVLSNLAYSAIEEHPFATPAQEKLYQALIQELRCLVCQNQNLADSNADLAKDLREKTYTMISAGKSRKEITQFMTDRYGDFVLYRPPVKTTTAVLWYGPFVLLILAAIMALHRVRQSRKPTNIDNVEGLEQAKALLKEE